MRSHFMNAKSCVFLSRTTECRSWKLSVHKVLRRLKETDIINTFAGYKARSAMRIVGKEVIKYRGRRPLRTLALMRENPIIK